MGYNPIFMTYFMMTYVLRFLHFGVWRKSIRRMVFQLQLYYWLCHYLLVYFQFILWSNNSLNKLRGFFLLLFFHFDGRWPRPVFYCCFNENNNNGKKHTIVVCIYIFIYIVLCLYIYVNKYVWLTVKVEISKRLISWPN